MHWQLLRHAENSVVTTHKGHTTAEFGKEDFQVLLLLFNRPTSTRDSHDENCLSWTSVKGTNIF